eukprot:3315213-Amphidinium_carterae.1
MHNPSSSNSKFRPLACYTRVVHIGYAQSCPTCVVSGLTQAEYKLISKSLADRANSRVIHPGLQATCYASNLSLSNVCLSLSKTCGLALVPGLEQKLQFLSILTAPTFQMALGVGK